LAEEQIIIQQLSNNLKEKLLLDANKIILKNSPIFKNNFSDNLLSKTGFIIHEVEYAPEEVIFQNGSKDFSIFFIL
jgi:hypothetical protein